MLNSTETRLQRATPERRLALDAVVAEGHTRLIDAGVREAVLPYMQIRYPRHGGRSRWDSRQAQENIGLGAGRRVYGINRWWNIPETDKGETKLTVVHPNLGAGRNDGKPYHKDEFAIENGYLAPSGFVYYDLPATRDQLRLIGNIAHRTRVLGFDIENVQTVIAERLTFEDNAPSETSLRQKVLQAGHDRLVHAGIREVIRPMLESSFDRADWGKDILGVRLGMSIETDAESGSTFPSLVVVHEKKGGRKDDDAWYVQRFAFVNGILAQMEGRHFMFKTTDEQAVAISELATIAQSYPESFSVADQLKNFSIQ